MAYSISEKVAPTTFGNKRVAVLSCVADAAEANIDSTLQAVDWVTITPKSLTAGEIGIQIGADSSGTADANVVGVSNVTSGDEFYLTCYGR